MNATTSPNWPAGKTLAIAVNVMLEGWSDDGAAHGAASTPLKPGFVDTRGQSWGRYAPTHGAPRLLKVLAAAGVKATFYTSGVIAERFPDLVRDIAAQGHAVQCHGYYQNVVPVYLDEPHEHEMIARCVETLGKVLGKAPRGWMSPRVTGSPRTPELLASAGFAYHADVCDADLPYRQQTKNGPIVAMPFTNEVNDQRVHLSFGNPPQAYTDGLKRVLDRWYSRHREPACLDITAHAHLFGRPYGAAEFEAALDIARATDYAWLTTHGELAAKCAA